MNKDYKRWWFVIYSSFIMKSAFHNIRRQWRHILATVYWVVGKCCWRCCCDSSVIATAYYVSLMFMCVFRAAELGHVVMLDRSKKWSHLPKWGSRISQQSHNTSLQVNSHDQWRSVYFCQFFYLFIYFWLVISSVFGQVFSGIGVVLKHQ